MKKIGLLSVICLGINVVVGAGIFLAPKSIFLNLGDYSMIVLILVMLVAIGLGLVFAEMASKYTKSGSSYVYVKENFGEYAGFLVAFTRFVAGFMLWAAMAVGFSDVLKSFFPFLDSKSYSLMISIGLTIILSLMCLRGIHFGKHVNNIFTIIKLVPLVLFIVVGIFHIDFSNIQVIPDFSAPRIDTFNLTSGILLIFFAFAGIEDVSFLASEMKDPEKSSPKAIISVLVIVSLLYFSIFLISSSLLGSDMINSSNPIQDGLIITMGKAGGSIASIGILLTILASNISIALLYSRRLTAIVESGALPLKLDSHNKKGVPIYSVIITAAFTCGAIIIGDFSILAEIVMITLIFQYALVMLALLKSRKNKVQGKVKAPLAKTFITLNFIVFIYILVSMGIKKLFFGLIIWIIIASILYLFIPKNKRS